MHVTIETATPRNLEELLKIERECFEAEAYTREHVLDLLNNRNAFTQIARVNGDAAGFVTGLVDSGEDVKAGHIVTIDVAVAYRRKGLGLTLLKEMENVLKKRGVKTIYLEVRVDNQAALKLYHKQGYVRTKSLKHYYSAGVHGLRMVKQL
ncbi:MAG TPA: ribosomal protein S18-alanine N-acetyltransferase [Candidatus Bathyarchaeia archaeon]|nr:ribosomal protein S18-alanine N-acetyltransferase [Candidatus Bathyarchaeia archaeon]